MSGNNSSDFNPNMVAAHSFIINIPLVFTVLFILWAFFTTLEKDQFYEALDFWRVAGFLSILFSIFLGILQYASKRVATTSDLEKSDLAKEYYSMMELLDYWKYSPWYRAFLLFWYLFFLMIGAMIMTLSLPILYGGMLTTPIALLIVFLAMISIAIIIIRTTRTFIYNKMMKK